MKLEEAVRNVQQDCEKCYANLIQKHGKLNITGCHDYGAFWGFAVNVGGTIPVGGIASIRKDSGDFFLFNPVTDWKTYHAGKAVDISAFLQDDQ